MFFLNLFYNERSKYREVNTGSTYSRSAVITTKLKIDLNDVFELTR